MQKEIKNLIDRTLKDLEIKEASFAVEHPADLAKGDYSTNAAMVLAKDVGKNPKILADEIVVKINEKLPDGISKVEAENGFINFFLSEKFFQDQVGEILKKKESYGSNDLGRRRKVLLEYSSPNIAKPFTIGHLRSTIIGDSMAKILEFSGHEVIRDNHLGDWGTQFGKMIVAIKKWGDLEALESDPEPIKTLVDLYVRFHKEVEENDELEEEGRVWFSKLEKGDKEAREIWEKCVSYSMKEFNKIYTRLGVADFDTMHGESFYEDKMEGVVEDIKKKEIGKESEGAFLIFFGEEKNMNPLMIQKKDGSSLYALRDLATDKWRKKEYGNDILIVNEVGGEQTEYFKQIYEAEEMLGYFPKSQRVHLAHGLYRFKDGKMSTRGGNAIWLEDIINESVKRAAEINKDVAEEVGIGAIKFNDLKRECKKDIIFDWEEIVNQNGDSGPYLQYSFARAKSILEKAKVLNISGNDEEKTSGWEVTELEKLMYRFPEVVERSAMEYEPHYIANFLIEIARSFNNFYGNTKILDEEGENTKYKIMLTEAFSVVVKNGLKLLGIKAPEKM